MSVDGLILSGNRQISFTNFGHSFVCELNTQLLRTGKYHCKIDLLFLGANESKLAQQDSHTVIPVIMK